MLFFFQAEDGIRDLVRSRGLGDVYKRQAVFLTAAGMELAHLAGNALANDPRVLIDQDAHVLSLIHI